MNYLASSLVLLVACADPADPPTTLTLSVDNVPATGEVTAVASHDHIDMTVIPDSAALAGEYLGALSFRIALVPTPGCSGQCPPSPAEVWLDGEHTTAAFEHGASTYETLPVQDPLLEGYYLLGEADDPLHLPRGKIAGRFTVQYLDADTALFQAMLGTSFELGTSPQSTFHQIYVSALYVPI